MIQYLITYEQLLDMVRFGQEHPNAEFYIEPMNDGMEIEDEFLSCSFYAPKTRRTISDSIISGIWELGYGKGDYDDEQ